MLRVPQLVARNTRTLKNLTRHLSLLGQRNCSVKCRDERNAGRNIKTDEKTVSTSIEAPKNGPEREISLLGPQDYRLPFPGNVGNKNDLEGKLPPFIERIMTEFGSVDELLDNGFNDDRIEKIVDHLQKLHSKPVIDDVMEYLQYLECKASECPELLLNDFRELFGNPNLGNKMTVITVCQRTNNDMKSFDAVVDLEREELMKQFVALSKGICHMLHKEGYWADFVDPNTGRPSGVGITQTATFMETDERYRHFGFEIEDLGCCKVISHSIWGTNSFVGSLFTNAPISSADVQLILKLLSS